MLIIFFYILLFTFFRVVISTKIERNLEIYLSSEVNEAITYDELMLYLGSHANVYGVISIEAVIEIYDEENEVYVVLDTTQEIVTGKYRVAYKAYNEEEYSYSFVYLDLVVEILQDSIEE